MVGVNGQQGAFFQIELHLPQRGNDLQANHVRADIVRPNLHNAGFFALCCRENRTEVQIMCEHDIIVVVA